MARRRLCAGRRRQRQRGGAGRSARTTLAPITADDTKIRIASSLAGRFGVPAAGGVNGGKAIYGYVTVKDGHAYFNGKPLAPDASAALADACHVTKK